MSLIIRNQETLQDKALIVLKHHVGNKTIIKKGDFTFIKINNNIVNINVQNATKYFPYRHGAKTLNQTEWNQLKKFEPSLKKHIFFQIGQVIERQKHPKSDKLFVLKVQTDKILQIVTNTLNSTVGKQVVVANIDAVLPNGQAIIKQSILGQTSEGMLCSGQTLNQAKTNGILLVSGQNGKEYII